MSCIKKYIKSFTLFFFETSKIFLIINQTKMIRQSVFLNATSQVFMKWRASSVIARRFQVLTVNELTLNQFGKGAEGLELVQRETKVDLRPGQVLVKLLNAPINPADLMEIEGKHGKGPQILPAVMGIEGLFEVLESGSHDNNKYKRGDWLLPIRTGWGSWRSHAVEDESTFYKIPKGLDKNLCSMLKINPCTAYRMLKDFGDLKPNDTVIQNGANGAVGQAVIQLGNILKLNVINIVRKRPTPEKQEALNNELKELGAKFIFTDEELSASPQLTDYLWNEIPKPRLALNCVGGKAVADLTRLLDSKSTVVTYGGMAKEPNELNTGDFVFKDLEAAGFWVTKWREDNPVEFERTVDYLCELVRREELKPPRCQILRLENYREAVYLAEQPQINSKVLFMA